MDASSLQHEADIEKALADRLHNESIQKQQDAAGLVSMGDDSSAQVDTQQANKLESDAKQHEQLAEQAHNNAIQKEREAQQVDSDIESHKKAIEDLKSKKTSILGRLF